MVLEDFLFPNENIRYQSPGYVKHASDWFDLYITDQRLIVHKRRGLVFKKDRVIAERLEDIDTLSFDEKGMIPKTGIWPVDRVISKTGILRVNTKTKRLVFEGDPADMKEIWQELHKFIKRPTAPPERVIVTKEKEVIKEVVMITCSYCGGLMPQTSVFCPNCGAGRKKKEPGKPLF